MTALLDLADTVEDLSKALSATREDWDWAIEDLNEVEKFLRQTAVSADLSVRMAELTEALLNARDFIDDGNPDWYLAQRRMLAEIDAALAPAGPMTKKD
jgi:hypothetical protein